jgi:glycosyltransferase involved in cell wall biosynthesis
MQFQAAHDLSRSDGRQKPVVSVIIPSYNYAHLIGATFESLQAQTFTNWECVVIDDGSTDNTAEVVARFSKSDPRIKFLRQQNRRQAAARNYGLAQTTGNYVQFLDADDLIEREKLEKQVRYLENHRNVDILYGSVRYFRSEAPSERLYTTWGVEKPWMPEVSGRGKDVLAALVKQNIMVINSALIRREVISRVGWFDDELTPAEDWDYWLRCAAADMTFQFEDLPDTLALVRWHPTSSSRDRRRMYTSMLRMRQKLESLTEDPDVRALNGTQIIDEQEALAFETIMHGPLKDLLREVFRASLNSRTKKRAIKWLACACAAPVVPRSSLTALMTTSPKAWLR